MRSLSSKIEDKVLGMSN